MENKSGISLEQNQTQRLLPLQVRVGRLLEMNSLEIEQEVKRALEEYPALEVADSSSPGISADDSSAATDSYGETSDQMQQADFAPDDIPPSFSNPQRSSVASLAAPFASQPEPTLAEYLDQQIDMAALDDTERVVAHYIVGSIDDNGYMSRTIRSIADDIEMQTGLSVPADKVRDVWRVVRGFDPAGVGAVDLRDALLLQLQRRDGSEPDVRNAVEIVSDYFDLFSLKHYEKIQSQTGMSRDELLAAIDVIRQLNPKPGASLSSSPLEENSRHIVPDFTVENIDGNLSLTLLNDIPELQIEQTFLNESELVRSASARQRREALSFIRVRRDEAKEFMSLLKSRQETLFRVMSAIMSLQKEFFITGDESEIRPMILKDVAAITGDDLSVISRATANKYVATAHGVYPLKIFFNEPVRIGKNTEASSSVRVVSMLRDIIADEDKSNPLADEAIVEIFRSQGLDIARRTVAKYRERLGIPVSRLRKEISNQNIQ